MSTISPAFQIESFKKALITLHLPWFIFFVALFSHLTHYRFYIFILFAAWLIQWNGSSSGQRFLFFPPSSLFLEHCLAGNRPLKNIWMNESSLKIFNFSSSYFFFKWSKMWYHIFKANHYQWTSLVAQMVKNLPAMQETQVRSLGQEDPLEKGKATHPSILAWRIQWTEEPGGLQSVGLQRVGHDWATNTTKHYYYLPVRFDSLTWNFLTTYESQKVFRHQVSLPPASLMPPAFLPKV